MAEDTKSKVGETEEEKVDRSARYPRYDIRIAEELARSVLDLGAKDVLQENVAKAVGLSGVANGVFKGRRAAAKYFGMVDYRGDRWISLTPQWLTTLHEGRDIAIARRKAVLNPPLYATLFAAFAGKQLPSADVLTRELFINPEYGIKKDAAADAASVFIESVKAAGLLTDRNFLVDPADVSPTTQGESPAGTPSVGQQRAQNPLPAEDEAPSIGEYKLDKIEVTLRADSTFGLPARRNYLYLSPTLSRAEKDRLKQYIELQPDAIPVEKQNSPAEE